MKTIRLLFLLATSTIAAPSMAQQSSKISTVEFVEVLNNNKAETLFYFENNWAVLRDKAVAKGYIHSYQLLETPASEPQPFQFILITTYANGQQYQQRETHFEELINASGGLKLLNEKKPGEFRKSLFSKEMVRHLR